MSYDRQVPLRAYADRSMRQKVREDRLSSFSLREVDDVNDDIYDRQVGRQPSPDLEACSDIDGEPMDEITPEHRDRGYKQYNRRSRSQSLHKLRGSSHRSDRSDLVEEPDNMGMFYRRTSRAKSPQLNSFERRDSRLAASELNGHQRLRKPPKRQEKLRYSCSRERDLRVTENYVTVVNEPVPKARTKEPDSSERQRNQTRSRVSKPKRHRSRSSKPCHLDSHSKERSKKRKRRRHSHKKSKKSRRRHTERAASIPICRGLDMQEPESPRPLPLKRGRRHKRTPRSVSPPPLLVEHVDPEEEAKQKQENIIRLAKMKASIVRQAVQLKLQQAKRKEENTEEIVNHKKNSVQNMFTFTDSPQENLKPTRTAKKLYMPRSRLGDSYDRHRRPPRRSYNRRSPDRRRHSQQNRIDYSLRPSSPSPSPPPLEPPKPEDKGVLNAICHLAEHVVKKDPTIEKKIYDKNIESKGGKRFRFLYEPDSVAGRYYAFLKRKLEAQMKKLK